VGVEGVGTGLEIEDAVVAAAADSTCVEADF
jgi:hypothetical protein